MPSLLSLDERVARAVDTAEYPAGALRPLTSSLCFLHSMSDQEMIRPSTEGAPLASIVGLGSGRLKVLDTHIHLNASFSGGLHNEWVAGEAH